MSRAFVKEDDGGTPEAQVDLPMSEHPNFVTPAGLQMLRDRVEAFEEQRARLKENEAALATQSQLPRVEQALHKSVERMRKPVLARRHVESETRSTSSVEHGSR